MADTPFKRAIDSLNATTAEEGLVEKVISDTITRATNHISYLNDQIAMMTKVREETNADLALAKSFAKKSGLPVPGEVAPQAAPPTLEDNKKAKLALLADLRWQNVTRSAVPFSGRQYSSDERSQAAYVAAAFLAGQVKNQTFDWKLKNGEHVTLTASAMISLATAVGAKVQRCFNTEAMVAAKIVAATTQAELDAVDLIFVPIAA